MTATDKRPYKMISSPIKWAGGKSRMRKRIVSLIPQHSCYVELFSGGAWVLFAKPPSDVEVLNDIDQELITFFRVVKNKPEELIKSFEWELVARAEFERLAALDSSELSDVQRAHRFFYLIMAGWGGEANYPRFQTSVSDGGHGNRLIGALKRLEKRILPVHNRLKNVIIENLSWEDCMNRYDRKQTFMYIDPPYPNNGVNYRHNMRDWETHHRLADRLKKTECKWIMSSYNIPEIHELYDDFVIIPIQTASGMSTKKNGSERTINEEVLVLNFEPPSDEIRLNPHQPSLEMKLSNT